MFRHTPRGFQMTFENGWTISIHYGYGNYCSNRYNEDCRTKLLFDCPNAEVAVWHGERGAVNFDMGWKTPDEVLVLMNKVTSLGGA